MKPDLKPVEADIGTVIAGVEDPFSNLDNLRLRQDFEATVGVKKLLTTVPVRKPLGQDFVRVHADPTYREAFPAIDLKGERELYLVTTGMHAELGPECVPVRMHTAINRQNVVFIWPVRLPGSDGKTNMWWQSAAEATELAMERWVRVRPNMSLGAYEIFEANGVLQEPTWPDLSFNELLRIAFRGNIISTPDHPVVKRLRGL